MLLQHHVRCTVKDDGGQTVKDDGGQTVKDDGGQTVKDDGGQTVKDDGGQTSKMEKDIEYTYVCMYVNACTGMRT
jgi:hypothetical protein